jgi:hypothetical protein
VRGDKDREGRLLPAAPSNGLLNRVQTARLTETHTTLYSCLHTLDGAAFHLIRISSTLPYTNPPARPDTPALHAPSPPTLTPYTQALSSVLYASSRCPLHSPHPHTHICTLSTPHTSTHAYTHAGTVECAVRVVPLP